MPLRPNAKDWIIKEQIVEDIASGLKLQFEVTPSGEPRLRVFGNKLPLGNREIHFNIRGEEVGGGSVMGPTKPTWPDPLIEE